MAQSLLFSAMILVLLIADISSTSAVTVEYYCPVENIVTKCLPTCTNDEQCGLGQKCCPNLCKGKTCVQTNTRILGLRPQDFKYPIYCNLVKCNDGEICQYDESIEAERCMKL